MSRVLADRAELERIALQLSAAKYVLEGDLLFNLVTHPIRNLLIEAEIFGLVGDIDKLLQACRIANENYFHGEALIDAGHEQLLQVLGQIERNFGSALSTATAVAAAGTLAMAGIGGNSAAIARRIESFTTSGLKNSLPGLVSRLKNVSRGSSALVRIESQVLGAYRQFRVFIPGTQAWLPIAGPNPLDLNSTLRALAGDSSSAAANSVRSAMLSAGIGSRAGDRVTFVGHSLGGVVAAQLAKHPELNGKSFVVSGVVSVAAPNSGIKLPDSVPAVYLEHSDDPAVYADGLAPQVSANHQSFVTQSPRLRLENHPLVGAHDLDVYQATAVDAVKSTQLPSGSGLGAVLKHIEGSADPSHPVSVQIFELERSN